jgi:acetyl-CoA synthase
MGLFDRVFRGSDEMYSLAEKAVDKTIEKLGAEAPVAFGSTAYFLPCIYAYTGGRSQRWANSRPRWSPSAP